MSHWLPEQWPKTVVSFEQQVNDENNKSGYRPVGTGFVFEYKNLNCLVTAGHVIFDDDGNERKDVFLAHNLKSGDIGVVALEKIKEFPPSVKWHRHPTTQADLAVIPFPYNTQEDDILRFSRDLFESFDNLIEGDEVFSLAFL